LVKIAKRQLELLKFGVVGAVNTGIDFSVFAFLFTLGIPLLPAHSLAYACGILNSFLLNKKWTFKQSGQAKVKQKDQSLGQLVKFVSLNLFTLLVTYVLLVWFSNNLGLPMLLSRLFAVGASFALNFTGSRFWVFRKPHYRNSIA
jgi:putative flippase GtrA